MASVSSKIVCGLFTLLASPAWSTDGTPLPSDTSVQLFMPDIVSTAYSEVRAAVSPDGNTVLWGSTDRPGGPGGWDIWMVRREHGTWSQPTPVSFDTPYEEFDPAFSHDGRSVWFFSNRPGGFGGDDIYRVDFDQRNGRFGKVEHLGREINSAGDEWATTPSPDGHQWLFATNGRGGSGRRDLFVSTWQKGKWQPATALPGGVNSIEDDFDAAYINDGRALVFARSTDVENDPIYLWVATRDADGAYRHAHLLDERINVAKNWTFGPSEDPMHPGTLLFSAQRPETRRGKSDIYSIRLDADDASP